MKIVNFTAINVNLGKDVTTYTGVIDIGVHLAVGVNDIDDAPLVTNIFAKFRTIWIGAKRMSQGPGAR